MDGCGTAVTVDGDPRLSAELSAVYWRWCSSFNVTSFFARDGTGEFVPDMSRIGTRAGMPVCGGSETAPRREIVACFQ